MRILFVSPFIPYPPTAGGHAQAWAWLSRLSREHEVAFVGFYEREREADGAEEIRRRCAHVRVRLRRPTPHAHMSLAQLPRWVTEFFSADLTGDIQAACRSFRPDVVQFLSTNMAQYGRLVGRAASVTTALEIGFVAYQRRIAATQGIERLQARLEWARMLHYETRVFRQADAVIAMSNHDARIVDAVAPGTKVAAVPPGVDREKLDPRHRSPVPGAVLYVGHMEHFPNLDGLIYLYGEIWPRVRRAYPQAKLTVAGRGAREGLARAAPAVLAGIERDTSVELAGFVDDLGAAMDTSAAMAAPLRLGGGVRNKVIEAMAAGLPVVTTSLGAEGLSVADGREVLIADGAQEFAQGLVRLFTDGDLNARLSAAGRELVAREHCNDHLAKRLEQALAEAAARRR